MLHTNEKWIEALDPKNLNIIKNLYVSNLGRVKKKAHSITVKSGHPRHYKERISSGTLKSDGYVSAFGYSLHTLVFCSFSKEIVGPGYVVHHKNNKRADNCLNNLEKVTFSENAG